MNLINGITQFNYHWVTGVLDASKQITLTTLVDMPVSILYNDVDFLQYTIDEGVITITNAERSEGDSVKILLFCMSKTERGGICPLIIIPAKNAKMQEYYDL